MKIGVDGSRAFKKERTGVEEYAYQIIRQWAKIWKDREILLYLRRGQEWQIDFPLGKKWRIRFIAWDNFWTQAGLSWEMLREAPDRFFSPSHVIPLIHPISVMTVHGLEYEHSPESYSRFSRGLHRFLIKNGCRWSRKIIAVSEKTKKDLIDFYQIPKEKIQVIHNGVSVPEKREWQKRREEIKKNRYLFFIGRMEKRKNVMGVIEVFEILKKKYHYSGQLILAGKPGYGYCEIKKRIKESAYRKEIVEKGFVSEKEKWELLAGADAVLYPSFSEGFGLPILEAQKMGVPIVASDIPSSREVAGRSDFLFAPENSQGMAKMLNQILTDEVFRQKMLIDGQKNAQKFSWEKCAYETARVILEEE